MTNARVVGFLSVPGMVIDADKVLKVVVEGNDIVNARFQGRGDRDLLILTPSGKEVKFGTLGKDDPTFVLSAIQRLQQTGVAEAVTNRVETPAQEQKSAQARAGRERQAAAPRPSDSSRVLAKGAIGSGDYITIYQDGTFTTGQWNPGRRDRLIGFTYEADSMRRKSVTGRTAAAFVSGGYSLAASNNRGVLYVTVIGRDTGAKTYTTRNPSNVVLSSVRELKAAFDSLSNVGAPAPATPVATGSIDLSGQLAKLAELHVAGALSDSEFADAKRRLLS